MTLLSIRYLCKYSQYFDAEENSAVQFTKETQVCVCVCVVNMTNTHQQRETQTYNIQRRKKYTQRPQISVSQ